MKVPLYKQIYESIVYDIEQGKIQYGDKIPSETELAAQFRVSRITSKKALDLLAQNNIIERIQGKGSFATRPPEKSQMDVFTTPEVQKDKTLIGLVISDFSDSYGTQLVKEIENNITKLSAELLIKISFEKLKDEEKAIDELIKAGVEGMIILPIHGEHYNRKILELVLKDFPIILVDRYLRGIQASSVSTDNFHGAKEITQYLIDRGHQNIGYLTGNYDGTTVLEDRLKGYQAALTDSHILLNPDWVHETEVTDLVYQDAEEKDFEKEIQRMRQFLCDHPEITSFVVCRYALAEVLKYVIESLDKRIPEDYSIVCFDSPPPFIGPAFFTHIKQDEKELGTRAVELLKEKMLGSKKLVNEMIPFHLIEGKSASELFDKIK